MKIAIASDHGGFELKEKIFEYLRNKNFFVENLGTKINQSCDYPEFAQKVCLGIKNGDFDRGILVCGTGVGMNIASNRFKGIRSVLGNDIFVAKMSRLHNDSNVLCLGGRVIACEMAYEIVNVWLGQPFEGGRHIKRIEMLENSIEK